MVTFGILLLALTALVAVNTKTMRPAITMTIMALLGAGCFLILEDMGPLAEAWRNSR